MRANYSLSNKYRVLLTEVLPYEMPLIIDNTAFFHRAQNAEEVKLLTDLCSIGKDDYTIPFDYKVRFRGGEKSRGLSLMHPIMQLKWVDLYDEYATYLLYLNSRSPFSLRYIHSKSNCIIDAEKMEKDELYSDGMSKIELLDACWNKQYQSYFRYQKYNMIHKFYEGGDYLRLEQKYKYKLQTDISKCFYHIYTHSVAWAIKGKVFSKDHVKDKNLFEQKLDRLMQHCNYNETNGIIVGPEVSRIFAEIILQRVDTDLIERLKEGDVPLRVGTDYEIRRYVDDYFIYANSEDKLERIHAALADCLIPYRLDLNESKTRVDMRPFSTLKSDAKSELQNLISNELRPYIVIGDGGMLKVPDSSDHLFKKVVVGVRNITHHYSLNYSDLTSYLLTLLRQVVRDVHKLKDVKVSDKLLLALCDISFYVYSLDMYATVSHKMCDIIYLLDLCSANTEHPELTKQEFIGRIEREAQRCIVLGAQDRNVDEVNLEAINLLLALDRIVTHPIGMDKLAFLMDKKYAKDIQPDDFKNLNYYQIVVLLYVMHNREDCDMWKLWLKDAMLDMYKTNKMWKKHADWVCLYLDALTCPYLDEAYKKQLIKNAECVDSAKSGQMFAKYKTVNQWFTDWSRSRDFGQIVEKKRYHFVYG